MADTRGCRAKDPEICRYHGALIVMENAQKTGNFEAYAEAKAIFDAEERKRKLLPFFYKEKPVGQENKTLLDLVESSEYRFSGKIEIHPEDEQIGIYKTIKVHGATREEVYDKLVVEAKKFADKMRQTLPKSRTAELNRNLRVTVSFPALRGIKDTDQNMLSSPSSINRLTHFVHQVGALEKQTFNAEVFHHRRNEGTWNEEDEKYLNRNRGAISSYDLTEAELLQPENRLTGNLIPLREPHEGDWKYHREQLRKQGIL